MSTTCGATCVARIAVTRSSIGSSREGRDWCQFRKCLICHAQDLTGMHARCGWPGQARPGQTTVEMGTWLLHRRTFGLDQLFRTCPRQNVIGGAGSRTGCPAALLHEIALLPAR